MNRIAEVREILIDNICIKNFKKVYKMKKDVICKKNEKIVNSNKWRKSFKKYINIGSNVALDVCEKFYTINIKRISRSNNIDGLNENDPILICMVKNDILRMKMILNYYRKLGVKLFAIIDDHSNDGTREYLLDQPDVDLFESDVPYTTNVRQARINRLIDLYGFNRWYLIVDSDELFTYVDCENIKINEYISNLNTKVVKSVMVDMYPKGQLFSKIEDYKDIEEQYIYYENCYFYEKNLKGLFVYGGNRSKIFDDDNSKIKFTTSKISLVFFTDGMIMCNSHNMFPYTYNFDKPTTVLRHYKFISNDIEKFKERIKKQNFAKGSKEYESYIKKLDSDGQIVMYNKKSIKWYDSSDVGKIINLIGDKYES